MPWPTLAQKLERNSIPEPNSGCLLWTGPYESSGYGQTAVPGMGNTKAHRAAWIVSKGPIPAGVQICHKCDVRGCIEITHLFAGTRQDNMDDMVAKGRQRHGARHAHAKLTPDQVRAIRADTRSSAQIAQDYPITASNIRSVKTGRCWSHVK